MTYTDLLKRMTARRNAERKGRSLDDIARAYWASHRGKTQLERAYTTSVATVNLRRAA